MIIRQCENRKIILGYPNQLNVITRVLKSRRGRQKKKARVRYDYGRESERCKVKST